MTETPRLDTSPAPFTVHLSKLQVWMPEPIHTMATHPDGRTLAVGREDGGIEITVPSEGHCVESRVPGKKEKALRSLVWLPGVYVAGDDGVEVEREPARLFGCGLDGTVFEVDLVRLCYKNVRDAYGGSAWCMRAAPSLGLLAVGCEDGSVRLFTAEGGGLEYKKSLPSTGSRVLSVAWGAGDDVIFAGGDKSLIHCFDASSGQSLLDMKLEKKAKEGEVLVWALETLGDGTVISGDSCGRVQVYTTTRKDGEVVEAFSFVAREVWDGLTGTQLQSLTTHEADVLCLCAAGDETEMFVSGCDGKVVLLERGPPRKAGVDSDSEINQPMSRIPRQEWEWSIGHTVRIHTHDVRALAIHEPSIESRPSDGRVRKGRTDQVLVSGGLDTSLSLYSVPGFKRLGPLSLEPLPPVPVAFLAQTPRMVLVMHNLHLDLWQLPESPAGNALERLGREERDANSEPHIVLSMEPKFEKGGHLSCATISTDGCMVAVSNTRATKVYRIGKPASPEKPLTAKKVPLPGNCTPPAHALSFTADGRKLIVAAAGGDIRVVDLDGTRKSDGDSKFVGGLRKRATSNLGRGARLVHCFEEHVDGVSVGGSGTLRDEGAVPIRAVTVSVCGKWMASASTSGVVHVFDLTTLRHHWTLPSFAPHRCMTLRFHCRHAVLACVDSSNAFRLFDVPKRRLAECHDHVKFPKPPLGRGSWGGVGSVHPLTGVTFNPEDQTYSMLLYNHRSVMYVTPGRKVPRKVVVEPRPTSTPPNKKARVDEGGESSADTRTSAHKSQSNFKMRQDFRSVVLLDFLAENEILVMENPWKSVRESLPDALDRKQYGV